MKIISIPLVIITILIILSTLFPNVILDWDRILATKSDSNNNNDSKNKAFIKKPDESFVEDPYNGTLIYYYTPKSNDLSITSGKWTIDDIHDRFPRAVDKMENKDSSKSFLVKESIVIDKSAELEISNSKILLYSSWKKNNVPTVMITYGKTTLSNSTITSWDPELNLPDYNPYHPRSFLIAKDGGIMNVFNSTISHLGFSLGGIHSLFSSLSALNYYNTTGFTIADSTIAHNLNGFYSDNSNKFKIMNNQIYNNIGYGLDPHSGSRDFIIDSNHVFLNGKQGIICSFRCSNVTITNNTVEYNSEGIGLHWLTNSSLIKDNIIKYNKHHGLFIKTNSYNNYLKHNFISGNGYGIGLFENSNNNSILYNSILDNVKTRNPIQSDKDSQNNLIKHNRIEK
jgi:hypothetical protein